MPVAKQITFEPLSTADWEMIEMEAAALEDGGLLNQITIVYPGQILPLRLIPPNKSHSLGGIETAAWVKVVDDSCDGEDFDSSDSDESDSDSSYSFNNPTHKTKSSEPCLRLMAETEVVVIPKPRVQQPEQISITKDEPINVPSKPLRIQPTTLDCPNADPELMEPYLLNPQISCVYLHPTTVLEIPGYESCEHSVDLETVVLLKASGQHMQRKKTDDKFAIAVANLYTDERVKEGHIGRQIKSQGLFAIS